MRYHHWNMKLKWLLKECARAYEIIHYQVLNNLWKKEIKESAKQALQMLTDIPKHERINKNHIDDILNIIASKTSEKTSHRLYDPIRRLH